MVALRTFQCARLRKSLKSLSFTKAEETACLSWTPKAFSLSNWLCPWGHTLMWASEDGKCLQVGWAQEQEAVFFSRVLKWDGVWLLWSQSPVQPVFPSSTQHTCSQYNFHLAAFLYPALKSCLLDNRAKKAVLTPACEFPTASIQASRTPLCLFLETRGTRSARASWESVRIVFWCRGAGACRCHWSVTCS